MSLNFERIISFLCKARLVSTTQVSRVVKQETGGTGFFLFFFNVSAKMLTLFASR